MKIYDFANNMESRDFPNVIIEFESVIFELLAEVFGSHVEAIT